MRSSTKCRIARFGIFEVDLDNRGLTKSGFRIRLQDQPFQVLALLLERQGSVVSRDELKERLWASDTFVAFDDGLNTAIKKLRTALNDSADNPRFVETVPRMGYRFIAPVIITDEMDGLPNPAMPSGAEHSPGQRSDLSSGRLKLQSLLFLPPQVRSVPAGRSTLFDGQSPLSPSRS